MIYEISHQTVDPERREEQIAIYKRAYHEWNPEGAHGGKILRSVEDPSRITVIIEWDDVDAHIRLRGTPGHVKFRQAMDQLLTAPSQVVHYLIEDL